MKVSVLVANYNNGKFFQDCYSSVLVQSYTDWEMIIVDDHSDDDSLEAILTLTQKDQRVKIYENSKNEGCGFTKRKAIELADGALCAFLDPDDTIEPNALKLLVQAHQENENVGLVYSRFRNVDEALIENSVFNNPKIVPNGQIDFLNLNGEISHFAMFKKEVYDKTSGIDPFLQRAVDQDLYLKLYEQAPVLFLDEILYNYRRHNNGISTGLNSRKAYFWKWVVIMSAAQRRGLNLENLFIVEMNENFAKPKQMLLENSWFYPLFRLEYKIKNWLNAR